MHWADVLAEELLEQGPAHVLATGITPSGPIHVGNLREVLTTEAVHRALQAAGGESHLIYIGDTYDPLRKVYPFLEDPAVNTAGIDYEDHVGKPLSEIPCPCGEHESYAQHFLEPFLQALDDLGIDPEVRLAHEMYEDGTYTAAIQAALDHAPRIREILEEQSGRDLEDHWLPLNVKCQACGRLTTTEPVLYEYPLVEYTCTCEHEGSVDVREFGIGKLAWRVDWPARWSFLDVTFEAFGKDHAAAGGSWDTAVPIAEEVYDEQAPHHAVYEFIHIKGAGAMHSSTGTAVAAEDVLQVTPPEVLRFFFMRYQPGKHVEFDPGLGLLDLVDEYDRMLVQWHETGQSDQIKDLDRVIALSQPRGDPPEHPGELVGMRHLSTVVQLYPDPDDVIASLLRSGTVDQLDPQEEAVVRERIQATQAWLETFAPDAVRFEVLDEVPHGVLQDAHRDRLAGLVQALEKAPWTGEGVQNAVYEAAEGLDTGAGQIFKAAYLSLLGQGRGPRLGPFLASMEKDGVLDRFRAAADGPG